MERTGLSARRLARIAGAVYLIVIIGGAFSLGFVPATLIVPGNAGATAHNIQAHELLYRLGLVAHLIILPLNVVLAVIFYDLFKVVSRRAALLVVFFTLVGTAVEGAYVLNQFAPLSLLNGTYAGSLTTPQLQALAYLPIDLATVGYSIQQLFYAGYLFSAAYLIFRSTFFPSLVGGLLAIGTLSYLAYSFASFLSPAFATHLVPYIQPPSLVGEGSFCLVLLIAGVDVQRWTEQAAG
jgi:hypothetical protein